MRGRLLHDDGDWYEWRQEPALDAAVYVRVVPGADGRLGVAELRVAGALSSELLRSIPVGRIEAAANAQLVGVADGGVRPVAAARDRTGRGEPGAGHHGAQVDQGGPPARLSRAGPSGQGRLTRYGATSVA